MLVSRLSFLEHRPTTTTYYSLQKTQIKPLHLTCEPINPNLLLHESLYFFAMDEEEIEKAVVAYLKKKGFKQTELAFQEEQQLNKNTNSQLDPDITKKILSFSE